jgi:hypothetical protein
MDATKIGQECMAAAQRGVAWLLKQQGSDGGWKTLDNAPVDAYYKAGAAFTLTGEIAAAEKALDYVKRHFLQADGDFLPRGDAWFIDVHYQYANGWITLGAQKLGRYDITTPAVRFLLSQQDPATGGFCSQKSVGGQKRRLDTMSSGIAGVACLAAGQLDAARKLAGYFEKMIAMQPAADKYYVTIEADGRLGTDFPPDEAFWRVVETTKPDQCWYAVGLPFVFSVLLYQATGEARYAKLAQWYLDFQVRCVNAWDGSSSGKAAWGSSILYHATGEERYLDIAAHVARKIIACQTPDGWFQWGGAPAYGGQAGSGGPQKKFTADDFDITNEYVVWTALIGSNLLAGAR